MVARVLISGDGAKIKENIRKILENKETIEVTDSFSDKAKQIENQIEFINVISKKEKE